MTEKRLKRLDRVLENIVLIFYSCIFLYYLPAMLAFLIFAIPFTLIIYFIFFAIYFIPHFFRDLSTSYTAEDMAEQRLDEEEIVYERADLALIEFWEYNVTYHFDFEFFRGLYWKEELDEQWDWLQRRGFELRRFTKEMMWLWREHDWYEELPNLVPMFPSLAFPDFWIDESTFYENEFLYKFVIIIAEDPVSFRPKGLHNPLTVERHNWYTGWWRNAIKLNKTLVAERAAHKDNLTEDQEGIADLHVVEEGQRGITTARNDRIYFLTPGGISTTTWSEVKQLEDLLMSDDEWELTDE